MVNVMPSVQVLDVVFVAIGKIVLFALKRKDG